MESFLRLKNILAAYRRPAVAYSGGADSTLLLYAAKAVHGDNCLGILVDTPLLDPAEVAAARATAAHHELPLRVITADPLALTAVAANHRDRCYHCKTFMMRTVRTAAAAAGCDVVCDGSNEDDRRSHRPGAAALRECGVVSPLQEANIDKDTVRQISRAGGLLTGDKPAKPCLLTRFPYGMAPPLTAADLARAAQGEALLAPYCRDNFRLRQDGKGTAWLAVSERDLVTVFTARREIVAALAALGFDDVKLDLQPFQSGAFDRKETR